MNVSKSNKSLLAVQPIKFTHEHAHCLLLDEDPYKVIYFSIHFQCGTGLIIISGKKLKSKAFTHLKLRTSCSKVEHCTRTTKLIRTTVEPLNRSNQESLNRIRQFVSSLDILQMNIAHEGY